MITTTQANKTIYRILTGNGELQNELSGGIYIRQRPEGSLLEDVVIDTEALTCEMPQSGTSHVLIYVPDLQVAIGSTQQRQPDVDRIDRLATLVYQQLHSVPTNNLLVWPAQETPLTNTPDNQHGLDIQLHWNILC